MIPILRLGNPADLKKAEALLGKLRLDPRQMILESAEDDASVRAILQDVARRGDAAIVDTAKRFDDSNFTAKDIRVSAEEIAAAPCACRLSR